MTGLRLVFWLQAWTRASDRHWIVGRRRLLLLEQATEDADLHCVQGSRESRFIVLSVAARLSEISVMPGEILNGYNRATYGRSRNTTRTLAVGDFATLGLSAPILASSGAGLDFTHPTPIQAAVIPRRPRGA